MPLTVAQARAAIRASTYHDADTQVTDAQLDIKINQERIRLLRDLQAYLPSLFETQSTIVISSGSSAFSKPADFERMRRLERQVNGDLFFAVPVAEALNANQSVVISYFEQGSTIQIRPTNSAPGTYRLTYLPISTALVDLAGVPDGLEDVIIERVAGWVRVRHDEDPAPHWQYSEKLWNDQRSALMRRYGLHPKPGLVRVRF